MLPLRFIRRKSFSIRLFWNQREYVNYNSIQNCRLSSSFSQLKTVDKTNLTEYISKITQEYEDLINSDTFDSNSRYLELKAVADIVKEKQTIIDSICSLKELIESDDKDISNLANEEKTQFESRLKDLDHSLIEALLPVDSEDFCDSIILEVQAGVGGQEAMLFAEEMFQMYCNFIVQKGWEYEVAEHFTTDIGGLRRASILINGPEVFKYFKYEAGVHRVQRTPVTEKGGRIHTSTISVVALPQPSDIDIKIEPKDLKIETKRSTGAGGQHVNTTDSAVRITHLPTNMSVECQTDRSQIKNRKFAMARLRAILYQKQLDEQIAKTKATRKTQVRSNNRNEKIRTYNYSQDRITDHRLEGVHFHNLQMFMASGNKLDEMIEQLDKQSKIACLLELIEKNYK